MSRWWPESWQLLVHPHESRLDREDGKMAYRQIVNAPATPEVAAWQPALTAALALVATHARRRSRLRVVVADHFVRYAVLPWNGHFFGQRLRKDTAQALMRNSFGESAERLEVALDQPRFGMNSVAAGIDRQLLTTLRQEIVGLGMHPDSIRPRALQELVLARQQLVDGSGWFCHADHDRIVLAELGAGNILSLRNQRVDAADPQTLARELTGLTTVAKAVVDCKRLYFRAHEVAAPQLREFETIVLKDAARTSPGARP